MSFFRAKRPWSRYKDFLLGSYLEPYIPKVARLRRPIVIIDCFAGRGRFDDGEPGSPLIIADVIRRWRQKNIEISGQFIEADPENFQALSDSLADHADFCTATFGSFDEVLPMIEQHARQNTVFLYVDPYSVRGLHFGRMKAVYEHIQQSSPSVEVLLNFNVAIFMRWALAAIKRISDMPEDESLETLTDDPNESVEHKTLSEIAGGEYWVEIASNETMSFTDKLDAFLAEYTLRMLGTFQFVCTYRVKEKYHHRVPKYFLVFATRHRDGALLMNDFMCKARRAFLVKHFSNNRLFDLTPDEEVVEPSELRQGINAVLGASQHPMHRPELQLRLLRSGMFARLTTSAINRTVSDMIRDGELFSSTGKARINDTVLVSVRPFA